MRIYFIDVGEAQEYMLRYRTRCEQEIKSVGKIPAAEINNVSIILAIEKKREGILINDIETIACLIRQSFPFQISISKYNQRCFSLKCITGFFFLYVYQMSLVVNLNLQTSTF